MTFMKLSFFALFYAILLFIPIISFAGEITHFEDGDTFKINGEFVRLYGVDCPESNQPYGSQATRYLKELVTGKTVEIKQIDTGDYGRPVVLVYANGKLINKKLVQNGYTWVYDYFCKDPICDEWKRLERKARNADLGLWSNPDPIPPWEWRDGVRHGNS